MFEIDFCFLLFGFYLFWLTITCWWNRIYHWTKYVRILRFNSHRLFIILGIYVFCCGISEQYDHTANCDSLPVQSNFAHFYFIFCESICWCSSFCQIIWTRGKTQRRLHIQQSNPHTIGKYGMTQKCQLSMWNRPKKYKYCHYWNTFFSNIVIVCYCI